jgi:hypothetical protein
VSPGWNRLDILFPSTLFLQFFMLLCSKSIAETARKDSLDPGRLKGSTPPLGDGSAREEAPMIFLMVECPSTGQIISTGITDGIDSLPKVGTRTQCPLCGQEHFWTSREVRFAESPSAKRKSPYKYQRFESSLA